jgi:hypothetical protein
MISAGLASRISSQRMIALTSYSRVRRILMYGSRNLALYLRIILGRMPNAAHRSFKLTLPAVAWRSN